MKQASTIALLALVCAGCAPTAASTDWSAIVTPYDPVPEACSARPAPAPLPRLKPHDGQQAAREYRRLKNAYYDLSNGYEKCQQWAKRQR